MPVSEKSAQVLLKWQSREADVAKRLLGQANKGNPSALRALSERAGIPVDDAKAAAGELGPDGLWRGVGPATPAPAAPPPVRAAPPPAAAPVAAPAPPRPAPPPPPAAAAPAPAPAPPPREAAPAVDPKVAFDRLYAALRGEKKLPALEAKELYLRALRPCVEAGLVEDASKQFTQKVKGFDTVLYVREPRTKIVFQIGVEKDGAMKIKFMPTA